MTRPGLTPFQRWQMKITIDHASGCWQWTAAVGDHGYPRFFLKSGVTASAHRWGYEQFIGPIPEGLELDHLCHTKDVPGCIATGSCVHKTCANPGHLEPVTQIENLKRGATFVMRDWYQRARAS